MTTSSKATANFLKCAISLCAIVSLCGIPAASLAKTYTAQTASNEVIKARLACRNLTAEKATKLRDIAQDLHYDDFIYESRAICQMLAQSKFAQAADYVQMARTYKSFLDDDEKSKPAMQCLKKAMQMDPDFGETYTLLGKMDNEDGRYKEALEMANKAVSCRSPDYSAYDTKATALANLNRHPEALQAIDLSIKYTPDSAESYRIKGSILENMRLYGPAVDAYRKAWQIKHTDWNVFRITRCLDMQNKFAEAIEELSQQIKRNPKDGEAYRERAMLKIKTKDLPGAIKDFDTCIALEPTAKTYRDRAKLHLQMGHKDLSSRDLAEAAKMESSPF